MIMLTIFYNVKNFDIILGKRLQQSSGIKLNVFMQNGFIFNRLQELKNDQILWKCAITNCGAVVSTNKMLRVIDNQNNVHVHDKSAYESYRRALKKLE